MNPYLSIWFNTKSTIDGILTGKIRFNYAIPILPSGLSLFIGQLKDELEIGLAFSITTIVIGIGLTYLFATRIVPFLILKIGRMWKGKSGLDELLIVTGLSYIPVILILIEQLIYLSGGKVLIDSNANIAIQWVVWIFYMRIFSIGLAKIQGFSYPIAFLNLMLSFLPFFLLRLVLDSLAV